VRGLASGVASGAAGLVIKPVSGGLDIISYTSQGINNATKTPEEM